MPYYYLLIDKHLKNKENKNCPVLIQCVFRFDTIATISGDENKIRDFGLDGNEIFYSFLKEK